MPFNLFFNLVGRADKLSSVQRAVSILVILSAISFISWGFSTHNFNRFYNAILPHNQTYTELAFNNINKLPGTVPIDHRISFSFWVHNDEGRTYTYPYTITIESGNTATTIKKGSFTLSSNGQKSIDESIAVPSSSNRQQVDVNLTSLNQSIDFWLQGNN